MKKIINGKIYDTDKAKDIGYISSGGYNDLGYVCETLYKKRTGEYFLHGDGGPMSKYAVYSSVNSWGGGQKIMPMTYEDARKWSEEHLSAEEYMEEFGTISDDGKDVRVTVQIPAAVADKLEKTAAKRGVSKTALIIELINNM